jgi:hypothetical protein
MSSRVLPKTRKKRFGVVRRIYELLQDDGFTQLEADEYLAGETEVQVPTTQRWRRQDSMPMGSQWSRLEGIQISLLNEANGGKPEVKKVAKPDSSAAKAEPRPVRQTIRAPIDKPGSDLVDEMMNGLVVRMNREQKIILWNKLSIQLMTAS